MVILSCISDFTVSHGLLVSLFLAGLVGGFSHCVGMCSPFVLAQCASKEGGGGSMERLSGTLLLPYHLGRMFTYVALAVLFSSLINLAFLFSDMRAFLTAPLLMMAGVLFLVSAFPVLGKLFPWAIKLQITKPFKFVSKATDRLMRSPGLFQKFSLGVVLGFMPCGLVISALMATATAATPYHAAMAMAAFAVGTMPALIIVGLGGKTLQYKYPRASKRFSQGAMTISAFWLFAIAGTLVF